MSYQICKRCVMDNRSDDTIAFDDKGYCNYCTDAINSMPKRYFPNEEGKKKIDELMFKIKKEGKGRNYDCLMGISGGLDSSYLAYIGHKYGLRILAIHVDDGFDTPNATDNIDKIAKSCKIDIIYERPDREQFFSLTKAFIKAGVPNIAIPQDNLIFAYLYKYAKKYGIKYFLSGGNFAMESILQRGNTHSAFDKKHIIDINNKFGTTPINKLQITSSFERKLQDQILCRIKEIRPLNYIDYNKVKAIQELEEFCGYKYYGGKHYESFLTMFMQAYYLPKKFNVDKRTSHLSSLIVSGQITREEALEELKKPLYNEKEMEKCIDRILALIKMTRKEFDIIMNTPPKQHSEFKTSSWKYISKLVRKIRGY